MLGPLRKLILAISRAGDDRRSRQDARRLAVLAIKAGDKLGDHLIEMQRLMDLQSAETAAWIAPAAIAAGQGGRFDACDLRHWLALAARCGVSAVPARVILELTEGEIEVASGSVDIGPTLAGRLRKVAFQMLGDAEPPAPRVLPDGEAVQEKLAAAMDDVPEGWMVRHVRCGPSTLKALAGCGLAGPEAPEVRFGAQLEVGPGWLRIGNRRQVDAADKRLVQGVAEGPDGSAVFVARPWIQAARFVAGEDPHRHGSQFAGKGIWPAEWRAFVERGRVIGVSFYYPWCGSVSAEHAEIALQVRDTAQRMADAAVAIGAVPVYMPIEFAREQKPELGEQFPRDAIACTLDFIETKDGLVFLEGGPPFSPVGGGHPCGFAGTGKTEGVAFRLMDGVNLGEPGTWADPKIWGTLSAAGAIVPWDEIGGAENGTG